MAAKSLVMLYVDGEADSAADARVEVPDITGLTISEANRLLRSYSLTLQVSGSGVAVSQSPEAGTRVTPTTCVSAAFEPPGG